MPGQELILIRHGQSTANATGVWQGQLEFPLSEEGQEQALLTGKALTGARLDAIYSSPLGRSFETAEIIARETGFREPVVPLEGLMERRGGSLEGTTHEERVARDPELTKKLLSLPEEERWSLVGAETDEEVLTRFERELSGIRARHGPGERLVIVTHGGVMRAFLRARFGPGVLPGPKRAANASITRIEWEADQEPRLLELASTYHLRSPPRVSATE
jgi:broad specificity phosphatase PhoE